METQYIGYIITTVLWIYINRMKILDFSTNNKIGKWTVGLIIAPVMVPIAVYMMYYWSKNDAFFRKIVKKVLYQKKITDYFYKSLNT